MFRKLVTMFAAATFVTGVADAGSHDRPQGRHPRPAELVRGARNSSAHEGRVGRHERRAPARLPVERAGRRREPDGPEDPLGPARRARPSRSFGLAQTGVTDILVFQLPGLFTSWAKLDSARDAMKDEFDSASRPRASPSSAGATSAPPSR